MSVTQTMLARCNEFFMAKMGLVDPDEQSRFLSLAMCGEAGELANLIKKEWRDGPTAERDAEIAEELADVQIYLWHLARTRGIDLDIECATKLEALKKRWPQAFVPKQDSGTGAK